MAVKDLALLPEHLRAAAVPIGADFAWPVDVAGEVIQVLTDAGCAIMAVDAWMLDEEGIPAVAGWTDYDLAEYAGDWAAMVAASRVEAEAALAGVMEDTTRDEVSHVGIDWQMEEDAAAAAVAAADAEKTPTTGTGAAGCIGNAAAEGAKAT